MRALKKIRKCLQDLACPIKAMSLQHFFKNRSKKADAARQKQIYNFYFANVAGINNWDMDVA
jgi:hypothetical protein